MVDVLDKQTKDLLYTKKTYYARGNFFQSTNPSKSDIFFLFPLNLIQFSEIIL